MTTRARVEHLYTQEDVNAFGQLMGARSRVHFAPEWARERLGGTIVPGLMLMAPLYQLARQLGSAPGCPATSVSAKFIRPVFVGHAFVAEALDGPDGFAAEIRSQGTLCVVGTLWLGPPRT